MKVRKRLLLILSLIWTLGLFIAVSYAWIARSWTPQLEYPNISISTAGALIITLEDENGEESVYNSVNVNEYMNLDEFTLKQVSSLDGKSFISANFNPILDDGVPIYDDNVDGKYIEIEFWLNTQYESDEQLRDRKKEIFIHSDSYIKYNPQNENDKSYNADLTVRMSIELQNINNDIPYILCKDRGTDDGATDDKYDYTLVAAKLDSVGKNIFTNYPTDKSFAYNTYATQKAYKLNYFDGSIPERVLFTIDTAAAQKVIVRIWLEGCDEFCQSDIAGKNLSILLKFDARDVETE